MKLYFILVLLGISQLADSQENTNQTGGRLRLDVKEIESEGTQILITREGEQNSEIVFDLFTALNDFNDADCDNEDWNEYKKYLKHSMTFFKSHLLTVLHKTLETYNKVKDVPDLVHYMKERIPQEILTSDVIKVCTEGEIMTRVFDKNKKIFKRFVGMACQSVIADNVQEQLNKEDFLTNLYQSVMNRDKEKFEELCENICARFDDSGLGEFINTLTSIVPTAKKFCDKIVYSSISKGDFSNEKVIALYSQALDEQSEKMANLHSKFQDLELESDKLEIKEFLHRKIMIEEHEVLELENEQKNIIYSFLEEYPELSSRIKLFGELTTSIKELILISLEDQTEIVDEISSKLHDKVIQAGKTLEKIEEDVQCLKKKIFNEFSDLKSCDQQSNILRTNLNSFINFIEQIEKHHNENKERYCELSEIFTTKQKEVANLLDMLEFVSEIVPKLESTVKNHECEIERIKNEARMNGKAKEFRPFEPKCQQKQTLKCPKQLSHARQLEKELDGYEMGMKELIKVEEAKNEELKGILLQIQRLEMAQKICRPSNLIKNNEIQIKKLQFCQKSLAIENEKEELSKKYLELREKAREKCHCLSQISGFIRIEKVEDKPEEDNFIYEAEVEQKLRVVKIKIEEAKSEIEAYKELLAERFVFYIPTLDMHAGRTSQIEAIQKLLEKTTSGREFLSKSTKTTTSGGSSFSKFNPTIKHLVTSTSGLFLDLPEFLTIRSSFRKDDCTKKSDLREHFLAKSEKREFTGGNTTKNFDAVMNRTGSSRTSCQSTCSSEERKFEPKGGCQ